MQLGKRGCFNALNFCEQFKHHNIVVPEINMTMIKLWLTPCLQDADIIVFPEYGLTGLGHSRQALRAMAEQVPDPTHTHSNPCHEHPPARHTMRTVLRGLAVEAQVNSSDVIQWSLSCLAEEYNLHVAVNMPSYVLCETAADPECPHDGFYLYNTNIVYDVTGTLVARYRKWTLYYEDAMDQPSTVDHAYFDTPFGRLATVVCFDLLFERPAIELVEEFHIDTALFPTAWRSQLPLMQGVGFHESWAILTGVNLLGSELHVPAAQFAGSGIYAGAQGAVNYYFDDALLSPGKLLVSRIPVHPAKPDDTSLPPPPRIDKHFDIFESMMRGDLYSFIALDWPAHEISIENENTSCYLNYSFNHRSVTERFAFAIFQGLHVSAHDSYLQVCALVKCGTSEDPDTCGHPVKYSNSTFDFVSIHGQFSSKYVYPSVVVDGGVPTGSLRGWHFTLDSKRHRAALQYQATEQPLVYASLYGRLYDLDTPLPPTDAASMSTLHMGALSLIALASAALALSLVLMASGRCPP